MAKVESTKDVFERYLPQRVSGDTKLAEEIGAKFQFNVSGDAGGHWTIDFTGDEGIVTEGIDESAECVIGLDAADVVGLFNNPMSGLKMMLTGKLKVEGKTTVASKLLKIL